jgi:hypothetical protein
VTSIPPEQAMARLDALIKKSRVHLYKPIQIAEILHRHRTVSDVSLNDVETYRSRSKKWRNEVCVKLLGRISTSSARFQDNLFDANAIPPDVLSALSLLNKHGEVEAYIYSAIKNRHLNMHNGLQIVVNATPATFNLQEFIDSFRRAPGLSRSVDKIYEIVVYAIFTTLLEQLDVHIQTRIANLDSAVMEEFSDFVEKVLGLTIADPIQDMRPYVYRVGVTNAADRGLDMWANFGLAIQIKHLSLTEPMANSIAVSIPADRIIIVCKDCEKNVLLSIINQIGQGGRIHAVITEHELIAWYEKALRGKCASLFGSRVLELLIKEIQLEFPSTHQEGFETFWNLREYCSTPNISTNDNKL